MRTASSGTYRGCIAMALLGLVAVVATSMLF
jgi:hypothetical protein